MMPANRYFSSILISSLCCSLFFVGCERTIDDLDPATFPANGEVFIDGFPGDLNYSAYGDSKVTAFNVDNTESYQGSASMRFEVPNVDDPNGGYAGGVFFTSTGRDLSGFDALTFWARSSEAILLDEIGFGNDFGASLYKAGLTGVPMNSNWQKYIIPIPDPSKLTGERGMLYFAEVAENEAGYTFWIDEVKFEKLGTIAHPKPRILDGQDQTISGEIGEVLTIGGLNVSFNMPTGVDQSMSLAPSYFSFSSSNASVANVNELGQVAVLDSGITVITAILAGTDADGSMTIESFGEAKRPKVAAPVPTIHPDSVISLFSDAYTNVIVDTWNTRWQFSTAEDTDLQVDGDNIKRYRNLNFVGIEFSSQTIDAREMTHFHIDIWTPDPTELPAAFKVLLVDFGSNGVFDGGDDSSHELSFTRPLLRSEQWVSIDIPLSIFTGLLEREHLAQLVLSGDLPTVFIDNVYFYNNGQATPTMPSEAAPDPVHAPADVISIFSDSYSNVAGTNLNPGWGQATVVTIEPIEGNNTLVYRGLNYQGIELGSSQDVTGMATLHLDVWSANSSALSVFLISPGPVETARVITVPTSGWSSLEIPLSEFVPVDLTNVFQMKFEGNGDIYIDNIYFHR